LLQTVASYCKLLNAIALQVIAGRCCYFKSLQTIEATASTQSNHKLTCANARFLQASASYCEPSKKLLQTIANRAKLLRAIASCWAPSQTNDQ
jgi:hypothetical protein